MLFAGIRLELQPYAVKRQAVGYGPSMRLACDAAALLCVHGTTAAIDPE